MTDASELAELVRAEVARQQPYQIMQVESVREDGTVNLVWGDDIIEGVPCNQSYANRKDNDVVLVLRHSAGWRVIDKVGAPIVTEIPEPIEMSFGPGAAPADYVQVSAVYMKNGGIYGQTALGPGPAASTPKPVRMDPSSQQGYRSGRRDNQRIAQGASPDYPKPWTSIWLFGTRIADACAGKTVDRMEVRVARTSKYHGSSRKVRPHLGLHDYSSAPSSTPDLSSRWYGDGLGLGQSLWMPIPSSQTAALASGSARGLGISAGVSNSDYLICTDGCGDVRVTFK